MVWEGFGRGSAGVRGLAFGRGLWAYGRGLVEVWSGFGRALVGVW